MVIKWLLLLSIVVRGFQNVRTLKRSSTVADMFWGIVEVLRHSVYLLCSYFLSFLLNEKDMGIVDKLEVKDMSLWDGSVGKGTELTITSSTAMQDAYIGCSIAVNGVCLTATSIDLPTVVSK